MQVDQIEGGLVTERDHGSTCLSSGCVETNEGSGSLLIVNH